MTATDINTIRARLARGMIEFLCRYLVMSGSKTDA